MNGYYLECIIDDVFVDISFVCFYVDNVLVVIVVWNIVYVYWIGKCLIFCCCGYCCKLDFLDVKIEIEFVGIEEWWKYIVDLGIY